MSRRLGALPALTARPTRTRADGRHSFIDLTDPSLNQSLTPPTGYPNHDVAAGRRRPAIPTTTWQPASLSRVTRRSSPAVTFSYDAVSDETDTSNPDAQSRPDDYTARDRGSRYWSSLGHGREERWLVHQRPPGYELRRPV